MWNSQRNQQPITAAAVHCGREKEQSQCRIGCWLIERTWLPMVLLLLLLLQPSSPLNHVTCHSATRPETEELMPCYAIRCPFTGVIWAFRPKVRKKSRKGFPGPLGPAGPQSQKTIENQWFFVHSIFDFFFWLFVPPRGQEAPGTLFETFFGLRAERPKSWLLQMVSDIASHVGHMVYTGTCNVGNCCTFPA